MKYIVDVVIDKPIDHVIKMFDDPERLKEWMAGLQSFEHLEGTPGEVGAKSKLSFKTGKREFEMIETVTVRNLPEEFSGTYEMDGVMNSITNRFFSVGNDQTRMQHETEFAFTTLFMKIMSFCLPFAFKKETRKILNSFKDYAERVEG